MSGRWDVHQHLWPEELLSALSRRSASPSLRRRDDGWVLRLDGEPDWSFAALDHDPDHRAALVAHDGLDVAAVALSSPLGIEALPADEAVELIDAYHRGVMELPTGLRAWAAAGLAEPDPLGLAAVLDAGLVGLCLPAGAVSGPAAVAHIAPLLATLESRSAAVFIHPGPAPWTRTPPSDAAERPAWWPALTDYVAQMQVAWLATREWVRPAFPRLRVCFAMLAGLAPLQAERLQARGGPAETHDPLTFYDTSSYGPRAITAMAGTVGRHALVHGSDRPVVAPATPVRPTPHPDPTRTANPARLLALQEVRT